MRWVVLAILVALVLWPFKSLAPDPSDAAAVAANALDAEYTEPYRVLAVELPAHDEEARQRLQALSGALFKVENAVITRFERTSGGWHARFEADIVCALATDSPDLNLREAAAFAMAYRTLCQTARDGRTLRHVVRGVVFSKRDGRWIAELLAPSETNP